MGIISTTNSWQPASFGGKLFKNYLLLPNHPSKVRVENWIGKLLFGNGIVVEGFGTKLQLDANDWITRTMIETGQFEGLSLQRASQLMQGGGLFVDIGANFGLYTCVLGNIKGVKCLSVDASPNIMKKLRQNLSLNPAVQTTEAQTALGSDFGKVKFFCPNEGNAGTSKTVNTDEEVAGEYIVIDCMPLNALLAEKATPPVRLIKIDIEGFEMEVFKSFDFHGPYRPANIIMEFMPQLSAMPFEEVRAFFESRGYELLNVEGEKLASGAKLVEDNLWLRDKQA